MNVCGSKKKMCTRILHEIVAKASLPYVALKSLNRHGGRLLMDFSQIQLIFKPLSSFLGLRAI